MAEIIAVDSDSQRQSRRVIEEGQTLLVGRAPRNGWAVPWDRLISREHAKVTFSNNQLTVTQLETARNPLIYQGVNTETFCLVGDESFRIGDTAFFFRTEMTAIDGDSIISEHIFEQAPFGQIGAEQFAPDQQPVEQPQAGQGDNLLASPFVNPAACLQALCQMPTLIAESASDSELADRVVELLLDSLRDALAVAVMQFGEEHDESIGESVAFDDLPSEPKLLRWSSRGDQVKRFRPSRRLIRRTFERQQSVVHLWMDEAEGNINFTMNDDLDWAFCTPIDVGRNERWCLYVSGRRQFSGVREVDSPKDLIGELRLAELMARFVGAVRQVRSLENQQSTMRQFFSPAVVETLANSTSSDALKPRLVPASVLFCDVRGFSRKVESACDNLHELLEQVSLALSVMTRSILKYEGVIADFQGDAALGFWGWPSASPDAAVHACRAALLIHETFAAANGETLAVGSLSDSQPVEKKNLAGFHVGIGLGHGEAIAGRIGSREQIKVGVFGPVVNLAARLQELTKQVGVPILIDEATANAVRDKLPEELAQLRRVIKLQPRGIETCVNVFALVPHFTTGRPMSSEELADYEAAAGNVESGNWQSAHSQLQKLPAGDPLVSYLQSIVGNGENLPEDWDGVVRMR